MVRSWSKFTGSFKLSWLSQQLLSCFLILRRLKPQEFLAVRSAGDYFRPSNRSPQSPQRRVSHHLRLCVKLTFQSVLLRPFKQTPKTGAANSRPLSVRARGDPLLLSFPRPPFRSRWLRPGSPRWGRRCGEEDSPPSSSSARTAAGWCGRGAEEDAKHQCHIYMSFFFAKKIPCIQWYRL